MVTYLYNMTYLGCNWIVRRNCQLLYHLIYKFKKSNTLVLKMNKLFMIIMFAEKLIM